MPKRKTKKRSKASLQLLYEFIKLQLAGNIPFWGTYFINYGLDMGLHVDKFQALLVATVLANAVFFIVDDRWVFNNARNTRKPADEIWRFVIFMSISALVTFNITWVLYSQFGVSTYIGQFISAGLSIAWNFIGLRFWVFAPSKRKAVKARKIARRA